ncbi:hypothetical protein BVG79_01640 [Ketogulonicigenium robustum]|uniref:Uncharacterized protein n=1 Tax=Ketogulonicigenium robustum TaxID=92947 RepID=A0A1W6P0L1_9RHOB|nr:hypothetical protein [Ketogulonicigenium robustum]ARO14984.1 hypothetical protein BVG79_01640 [Ketogulonicigenium robustum]
MTFFRQISPLIAALSLAMGASAAGAQQVVPGRLGIEANAKEDVDGACRVSFLATNGLDENLYKLSFEAVVFDKAGEAAQFTLLEFTELNKGAVRVRQFDLRGRSCDDVGQVVVNRTLTCEAVGLDPSACAQNLDVTSRISTNEVTEGQVAIELNRLESFEGSCRLTFVTRNGLSQPIAGMMAETVLFDPNGGVAKMTMFELGDVAAGQTRVRRYEVTGNACDGLGNVLINQWQTCEAGDLGEEACTAAITLSSRTALGLLD